MRMTTEQIRAAKRTDLEARMKEIATESETRTGEELKALLEEMEEIESVIIEAQNREKLKGMAVTAEPKDGKEEKKTLKNERGEKLKTGGTVKMDAAATIKAALTMANVAPTTHTSTDVKEAFEDVSTIVDRVKIVSLEGGETYQRAFVKNYGDGAGGTDENTEYNATEPVFGYATIEKEKITAYTEEPEEMTKLPAADYDTVVGGSVSQAVKRYMARMIINGDGTTGKFKGIFCNPTKATEQVIDPTTDIEVTAIDETTLDEIVYSYGGDEETESEATLILNKKDLKEFAKVRDKQGRKVYTIVNNGNTGTIDGVPYIINGSCATLTAATTVAGTYCMAYGALDNYELALFSDIDVRRSTEYKFKQGQVAYRADVFAGGAVCKYNGFVRVKKGA